MTKQYTVKIKGLNVREIYAGGGFSGVNLKEVSITPHPDGARWVVSIDGNHVATTEVPFDVLRDCINKKLGATTTT